MLRVSLKLHGTEFGRRVGPVLIRHLESRNGGFEFEFQVQRAGGVRCSLQTGGAKLRLTEAQSAGPVDGVTQLLVFKSWGGGWGAGNRQSGDAQRGHAGKPVEWRPH